MKSIASLLTVACFAALGFTGCCTQGSQKTCAMTKKSSCCASSSAACPMKKTSQSPSQ